MARTVEAILKATTSGFDSAVTSASAKMQKLGQDSVAAGAKIDTAMTRAGSGAKRFGTAFAAGVTKNQSHIDNLARGAGLMGAAIAVGVGAAVKSFADFDQAMSGVAATGADARSNMDALRKAAIDAGASTSFSATEAASGIEELAKAGISAQDTLGGGLRGSLDLAAAGSLSVGQAAEVAATAMNQFGLAGRDVPQIANLLAQGAGVASGEVSDMGAALKQSGLVAAQFGLSIDESVQSLSLFAKNGLIGSDAGTSFKTMLSQLYAPTGAAAKQLKELGISAQDSAGNLKPYGVLIDEVKARLDTLSEGDRVAAMKDIFGSDAIRAGTILMKGGSAALAEMQGEFDKYGTAAQVAATKLDNLKGDIEGFTGALESAFINSGSGGNDFLRGLVQGATDAVNAFNGLPPSVQQGTLAVAAIAGAGLLGAAGIAKLVVGAVEAQAAISSLATSAPRAAGAVKVLSGALVVAGAAFAGMQILGAIDKQLNGSFTPSVERAEAALRKFKSGDQVDLDQMFKLGTTGIVGSVDSIDSALQRLGQNNWYDALERGMGVVSGQTISLTGQIKATTTALDTSLNSLVSGGKTDEAAAQFTKIAESAARQRMPVEQLVGLFPQYAESVRSAAEANGITNLSAQQLSDIMAGRLNTSTKASQFAMDQYAQAAALAGTSGAQVAAGASAAAGGMKKTADATKELPPTLDEVISKLYATSNALLAMSGGQIGMEAAIDAANASLKENGKTLDLNTEKGRANQQALNGLAQATQENVSAMTKAAAPAAEIAAANERGRASFIRLATSMGQPRDEAVKLADSLFKIPADVKSQVVIAGGDISRKEAQSLNKELQSIPKEKRAEIVTIAETKGVDAARQAMAEIKDKEVIAKAKAVGANDVKGIAASIKALKSREVLARARGDKKGADQVRAAINLLKSRTVDAKAKPSGAPGVKDINSAMRAMKNRSVDAKAKPSGESGVKGINSSMRAMRNRSVDAKARASGEAGVRGINSAINAMRSRSVTATVTTRRITEIITRGRAASGRGSRPDDGPPATGGLITRDGGVAFRGPLGYAGGGPVWGAGTATSDSIEAYLSHGEFVQRAKATSYYGVGFMDALNNLRIPREELPTGFAKGGIVGYAAGGTVDVAYIERLIRALSSPLANIATLTARANAANAKIGAPYTRMTRANAACTVAVDRRDDIKSRIIDLQKAAAATKGVTKADKDLAAARRALARQNIVVSKTSREKTAATAAYNKVAGPAKDATNALREAQKALADSARQVSQTFKDAASTTSTDPLDVLARKRETATQLALFNQQLLQLRKAGLNSTDVQSIIDRGALDGSELAAAILKGGQSLIKSLNSAQSALTKAADAIGYTASTGVIRRAGGGEVFGPGGPREDRVRLWASNGEYVVNADSYAANAGLVKAINNGDGRNITGDIIRGMQAYGGSGMSSVSNHRSIAIPVTIGQVGLGEAQVAQRVQGKVMDALVMSGLAGVAG